MSIPISMPRTDTIAYFAKGRAFGTPHARPATAELPDRTWDDEQIAGAVTAIGAGKDVHPDLLRALASRYLDLVQAEATHADQLRALASRYLDLVQAEATHADQLRAAQQSVSALSAELIGERLERNRLAALHAETSQLAAALQRQFLQVSTDNLYLRHSRAGTTPVAVRIALARASIDSRFDDSETQVMP